MKSMLKRFAFFYLNSWWLPPVLYAASVMVKIWAGWFFDDWVIQKEVEQLRLVGDYDFNYIFPMQQCYWSLVVATAVVSWCLGIGMLVNWTWLLVKKQWCKAAKGVVMFITALVGFWVVSFLLYIFVMDFMPKDTKIEFPQEDVIMEVSLQEEGAVVSSTVKKKKPSELHIIREPRHWSLWEVLFLP